MTPGTPMPTAPASPADLSVAIVCRNNERTIGRVLDSVRGLAAQLVVIDSGSTDRTMDLVLACRPWAEVVLLQTAWRGHIATKQAALRAATRAHVLCIDSDEPLTPELAASVRAACARGTEAARVNRMVEYRGTLLRHCWQPEPRLRLVRRDLVESGKARWGGLDPHDKLETAPGVRVENLPGTLIHESFASFEEHLGNQLRLQSVSARSLARAGRTGGVLRLITSPAGAFFKQVVLKGGWRDGRAGWLAGGSAAAGALMKHMILLEQSDPRPERPASRSPL